MKAPNIVHVEDVILFANTNQMSRDGKTWHPCRSSGYDTIPYRLRAVWLVLTGRADALIWPAGQ